MAPDNASPMLAVAVDDALLKAVDDVRARIVRDNALTPATRAEVVESLLRMALATPEDRPRIAQLVIEHRKLVGGRPGR